MATLKLPKKKTGVEKDAEKRRLALEVREERVAKATEWLIQTYSAFREILPLAIGSGKVTHNLRPKSISGNVLAIARNRWCASPRYLAKLAAPGSTRHYLNGEIACPVSDEHREQAAKKLEKL